MCLFLHVCLFPHVSLTDAQKIFPRRVHLWISAAGGIEASFKMTDRSISGSGAAGWRKETDGMRGAPGVGCTPEKSGDKVESGKKVNCRSCLYGGGKRFMDT